jgi:hypothetical protein
MTMTLLQLQRISVGQVGIIPGDVKMITTANLATITAAGYLNGVGTQLQEVLLANNDVVECLYNYNVSTGSGTLGFFQPSIVKGVITLGLWENPGNVLLPVVSGHFAVFNGTSGQIYDDGYLPSNAALTNVVMQSGASVIGDIPKYNDVNGTLVDSGILATNLVTKNTSNQMAAGGEILLDKGTGTVSTGAVTINKQSGVITGTFTTAAAGTTSVTFNNSEITSTSVILVSLMGGSNTIPGVQLSCAYASSGVATLVVTNNNVAGSALSGTLIIGFVVL